MDCLSQCLICDADDLEVLDGECNISRCVSCGYIFDNPRPTLDELVSFYSRPSQYDSWLDQLGARERMWKRRLNLVLPFRKAGSLLDVGAGIGQFLALARSHFDGVFGTEVSSSAITIAKDKYNLGLFPGTLEQLAQRGPTFDNISLFHVLEHVPDPALLLRTCHRLLAPGGVLIIAVPNEVACLRATLKRPLVAAGFLRPRPGAGRFGLQRIRLVDDTAEVHLSHFTPKVLDTLLQRTGYSVMKRTLDPHYIRSARVEKMRADAYYYFCLALHRLTGKNIYDTMLVIARKTS